MTEEEFLASLNNDELNVLIAFTGTFTTLFSQQVIAKFLAVKGYGF